VPASSDSSATAAGVTSTHLAGSWPGSFRVNQAAVAGVTEVDPVNQPPGDVRPAKNRVPVLRRSCNGQVAQRSQHTVESWHLHHPPVGEGGSKLPAGKEDLRQ